MSLQVWLPLNGNFENKGLEDIIVTNNNGTFADGGKIGAKAFTMSAYASFFVPSLARKNIFSVSFWYKPISNESITANWCRVLVFTTYNTDGTSGSLFRFESSYGSVASTYALSVHNNSGQPISSVGHTLTGIWDKWHHIVATSDGVKMKTYCDGQLIRTDTCNGGTLTGTVYMGYIGTRPDGLMNDVRIYDHALSLKEIKEISKGLVLHYPLNRDGIGQNNIIKNSDKGIGLNGSDYGSMTTHNFDSATGIGRIEIISNTGCWNRWRFGKNDLETNPVELTSGVTTYTFSSDIRVTNYTTGTIALTFDFRTNNIVHSTARYILTNAETDGQWHRVSASLTTNKQDDTQCLFCISSKGTVGNIGMVVEYKHFKLEMGSKATSWCPNSSDELATILGLNNNEVYDCSGFENNGTRVGTFSWTENTPRYNTSTVFNGVDNAIQTPSLPTMITDKNYTISVWTYKDSIGSKSYQTIYGGQSGFELEARNSGGTSPQYVGWSWGKPVANYEFSKWNHFCFVHSDADCKLYVNGEYISSGTAKDSNPAGNYFIGAWKTSGQQNYEGLMSDFRIYATALSADDVKSLYQVTTSADKNNNYYSYSYNELTQNREIEYMYNLVKSSGSGTFIQNKDGLNLNNNIWVNHDYISINPTGKTYKYDIIYSCDAGNQFYIGWERYDANKTLKSNNACVYVISTKPSTNVVTNRVKGTVDLSTDGVNSCAFIRLRILNKWTGSASDTKGTAIIHSLSLKEYSSDNVLTPLNHTKQGIVNTTEILEKDIGVSINDTYELSSNIFYEI